MDLNRAITRLLANTELRKDFRDNREALANRLGVRTQDRPTFDSIDVDGLDRQAACLLNKRYYEVARIVPRTIKALGPDARQQFQQYAADFWPVGHRRHWIDAHRFCKWLSLNRDARICRAEWNWVRFLLTRRPIAVHLLFDPVVGNGPRVSLQLFTRKGGSPRWRLLYFNLPEFTRKWTGR